MESVLLLPEWPQTLTICFQITQLILIYNWEVLIDTIFKE